jgi:predicted nuclease of predicted toxin-antitoxin system
MKLSDCKFFTDENIQRPVIEYLKQIGLDIFDVNENGLGGSIDIDLLEMANREQRIVLTHDSDFGTLTIMNKRPFFGIVYLKPGHIEPHYTIDSIKAVLEIENFVSPSIITVRNTGTQIRIRVRQVLS